VCWPSSGGGSALRSPADSKANGGATSSSSPRFERGDPVVGRPRQEDLPEDGQQLVAVAHASRVGREALVGGELGPVEHLAEPSVEAVVGGRDGDPTVLGREHLVGNDARVRVAYRGGSLPLTSAFCATLTSPASAESASTIVA
jgi:hypothetical protein